MERKENTDVNFQEIEPKAEEYLNKSTSTQVTPNPSPIIINIFPYKSMSHLRLALHKLFYQQYQIPQNILFQGAMEPEIEVQVLDEMELEGIALFLIETQLTWTWLTTL